MNDKPKLFIKHGIFKWNISEGFNITFRNTNKHFPLPLKFRRSLNSYYLRWFHVQKTIKYHNRKIKINVLLDGKIEFTVAHCPDIDIMTISICHPFRDQFRRKTGVFLVMKRMEWALENLNEEEPWWKYSLRR